MTTWAEVEPILREKAYRTLERDPQILFEGDGGPVGLDADLIYARLIGFEDEVVKDGVRLPRVEPDILLPIPRRPLLLSADAAGITYEMEPTRVARYTLQSGYATLSVSGMYNPPVERLRPDNSARIAYVRYRRRA